MLSILISTLIRFFLCLIPYLILVSNRQIIYNITGPITIPPFDKISLIYWIGGIQLIRIFYPYIIKGIFYIINKNKIKNYNHQQSQYPLLFNVMRISHEKNTNQRYEYLNKLTSKYVIVLIMKLILIFSQTHRMKYYLHVFFLQLFLLAINILADIVNNHKVSQVIDIIALDGINRIVIFYQLTRTFNPNFGLYFFANNLLSLLCNQLSNKRIKTLYVNFDIYRVMAITLGYLCLFALLQSSITYKPLIIIGLTGYFYVMAIKEFKNILQTKQEDNNKKSLYYLFIAVAITISIELGSIYWDWNSNVTQNTPINNLLLSQNNHQSIL